MEWMIGKVVAYMIRNDAFSAKDEDAIEIHKYGLYCLITDVIDFSILLILSLSFGVFMRTFFYYVAFIGLRRFAGGYHAKTFLRCFVISMVTWAISMVLLVHLERYILVTIIGAGISCVPVILWAPMEHVNHPMSDRKKAAKRKGSIVYVLALFFAVCLGVLCARFGLPNWMPASVSWGMVFFAGSLTVAKALDRPQQAT